VATHDGPPACDVTHRVTEAKIKIPAGKAIVIRGSGRGIGAACAKGCARRGATVVVNDVRAVEVEETVAAIRAFG
jgi:NADP-dependent 3-hydroxy acid dehydrogenase YdfG